VASDRHSAPVLPLAYRTVLLAAALLLAWRLFMQLTVLLLAIVLAVIIALPLDIGTTWLQRRLKVPRALGAPVLMLLALAVLGGLLALLVPRVVSQAQAFVDELPWLLDALPGNRALLADLNVVGLLQGYLDQPLRLIGRVTNVLTTLAAVVGGVLLVVFAAVYMAIRPEPLVDGLVRLVVPGRRDTALRILRRLRATWLGWLRGVVVDATLTGALTYLGLSLIGLDYALIFAVLTALLETIPYIGPIVATVPPVLFALTQSVELAVLTLVVFVIIQQLEGHLIVPLVMSRTVELHPALLAFGVVLIGAFLGVMGLLLAVPILAGIVVLVQELWVRPKEHQAAGAPGEPVAA
jgi:predicted PurR-regulated permease PerM